MPNPQRVIAYDALRVFAIVSVVAIHTLMPYRELLGSAAPVRVFDDLLHYAVPLFVFISGVFVWGRDYAGGGHSFRTFFSRRIAVVLVPFVVWSLLYLAILAIREPTTLTLTRTTALFITGHTWYHLYFVPMLMTFYLLTPIASRVRAISPELLLIGCYLIRILLGPSITGFSRELLGVSGWAFATHVLTHLPHMALGAWFSVRQKGLPRQLWFSIGLLLAGTAILTAASLGATRELPVYLSRLVYPSGMAATVLGMALLALRAEPRLERFTPLIVTGSALAFGVYFVHPLFLMGVDAAVSTTGGRALWLSPWFPVVVFCAVTGASFAFAYGLAKLPGACRLVGMSRPLAAQGQRTR